MDKRVVYPSAIPLAEDVLRTNYYAEIALAKAMQAFIGDGPAIRGLACTPTTPSPSLQVVIGSGEVYAMASLLPVAYSSIPQDTTHQVLKQGILMDAVNLTCTAPGTVGQSTNYLVQVAMSESDADLTLLQYWNAATPSQPLSGPGGNGVSQALTRKCGVAVQLKAGTAATTGSQTTPTPDAGYIGAWVVTVAQGQTTITSGNISQYPGALFVGAGLGVRPAVAVNRSTNQSISTATQTKVQFTTVELDSNSSWDATNNRFLPKVPGYYMVSAAMQLTASVDQAAVAISAYKNGSNYRSSPPSRMSGTGTSGAALMLPLFYLNGSTDYLEIFGYQDTGSGQQIGSAWLQAIKAL